MQSTEQKLREALQAISHIDDTTNHSVDASAALDRIGQIARQALAMPTAEPVGERDAVDAKRYRWLKGRSQVCLNQVWIGGYTTRQRDVDFLSKEDALSAIDTAIDAAMRKGQP